MGIMGIGASYDIDRMVSYKPEYSWNFEIGSHLGFFKGRLVVDVSVFYIDCRDQQLTMFPDGTTTGRMMTNAGKTRSFGLGRRFRPRLRTIFPYVPLMDIPMPSSESF